MMKLYMLLTKAEALNSGVPYCPTMMVSAIPCTITPNWPTTMGRPRREIALICELIGRTTCYMSFYL